MRYAKLALISIPMMLYYIRVLSSSYLRRQSNLGCLWVDKGGTGTEHRQGGCWADLGAGLFSFKKSFKLLLPGMTLAMNGKHILPSARTLSHVISNFVVGFCPLSRNYRRPSTPRQSNILVSDTVPYRSPPARLHSDN